VQFDLGDTSSHVVGMVTGGSALVVQKNSWRFDMALELFKRHFLRDMPGLSQLQYAYSAWATLLYRQDPFGDF